LLLGPHSARRLCLLLVSHWQYHRNFKVAQLRLGLSLNSNGRLCSGFRCFKANPCRNSAFFPTLAVSVVHPSSHTYTPLALDSCSPSSSLHTLPLRTTFPSFSSVYMFKRVKKQPLAYFKRQVHLLSTDFLPSILDERNDSLRVIWLPPLYSTSYGSSKTTKLHS
jgi:hypothetical protein